MRLNRTTRAITTLTLTGVLGLAATACGGDTSSSSSSTDASATEHADSDVAFATQMLPHHAQALTMVELTKGRPLDPAVQRLAADIRAAQAPEIETMTGWLEDWSEPVPETGGGMDGMDGMDGMEGMDSSMPGMMSADDMTGLRQASDADFQTMWLELMVAHHEGAVEMARTEIADGRYQPAVDLADAIVISQSKEIDTMNGLLG